MRSLKRSIIITVICVLCAAALGIAVYLVTRDEKIESPAIASPTATLLPSPTPLPSPEPTPEPTLAPTPEPTPEPTPSTVKMSVTGDLMCHMWQMDFARKPDGSYDFNYAFQYVKAYLSDADWTVGNLETTFGGVEDRGHTGYPMFNSPDEFGEAIKNAGYDFLSTANNHSNDRWEDGILRTLSILDGLGIEHTGTYASQEERDTIYMKEINGMTFAFVAYTYGTNGLNLTAGKPYLCNIMGNGVQLAADIRSARALNPDFVVVMPHMGNEYELAPKQIFKDWADLMFDAGADIILASHPHVLQPVEFSVREDENGISRNCFIIYSLGNFISSQRDVPREAGVILNLYFERAPEGGPARLDKVGFIPTWVKFTNNTGAYDITVLSVHDALTNPDGGGADLRPQDVARLENVHAETTKMMLGESLPLEGIQNEYFMPGWE